MLTTHLAAIVTAALGAGPSTTPDASMLRYPDIGKTDIVFVFQGNLWLVPKSGGMARPLTSAAGAESMPRFSPDGTEIAFTGNYDGNRDIYVMPTVGGSPFRVTHHPAGETVNEWTTDGSLVFTAAGMEGISRSGRLYKVKETGGLPEALPVPYGTNGTISPDGEWLAYTPHSIDGRTWKRYRGGMQTDVWVYNLKTGEARRATDYEGIDTLPMWQGSTLYYLSDDTADKNAPHKLNIWSWEPKSGARKQVTRFTDEDVKWPAIGDGEIVFQKGTKLMVLDLGSGKSRTVDVKIPGDRPAVRTRTEDVSDELQGSGISPSAKRVAVAARGDIWSAPAENGVPRNMTRTDGIAERNPAWSPDGKWIAYFDDSTGEYELWAMPADGKGAKKQLTTDGGPFKTSIQWFPDSKKLIYQDKTCTAYLVDFETGERKTIDKEPWDGGLDLSVSHNGAYIAYAKSLPDRRTASIWIYDVAKGESHEVTSGEFNDGNPTFDRAGDWLYFASARGFGKAEYSELDESWVYQGTMRGYAVPLRKDVKNPWALEIDEEKGKDAKPDEKKDEKKDEGTPGGNAGGGPGGAAGGQGGPGGDRPRRHRPSGEFGDASAFVALQDAGDDLDDEPKKDEPKKDEPKKDEPKPDAPKQEEKAAAPAATGPAGTWNCSTKEGEKVVTFTLVVTLGDAGAVTAKFTSDQRNGDLTGQWDAEAKKLTLTGKDGAGTEKEMTYSLEATVDGDAITGNATATGKDVNASYSFTGTRAADAKKDDKKDEKKDEKKPFTIDYEGFEGRAIELPLGSERFGGMAVNDKGQLIFAQGGQVKVFDIKDKKKEVKKVTDGMGFQLTADGRKMLAGLNILDASAGAAGKPIVSQPMLTEIDPKHEWKQVTKDAWRIFRDYFYDPNMHGVDWPAVGQRYLAMVDDANSREDVSYIISEMISELNVGHAYYNPSPRDSGGGGPSINVGMLGVDWSTSIGPDGKNVYSFRHIVEGAPWDADARNPLKELGVDVKEGEYLLAVNGLPVDGSKDPWAAFQGLAGKTVSLTVGPNPSMDDKVREVVIKPMGGEDNIRYRDWIEANRRYVSEKSGGKVGYVYVPNTGIDGQSDLVRQYQGEQFKQGLIIDDRWNGGGQIPNRFIELLNRPITNYWARRDQHDWIWPGGAHHGPKAMLINGLAGSGGDMFPWLFRHHKLGPLVGTRTWGGLVGISGNPGMIDGSGVRVPVFAFYETDGTWGIEGHGVDPDAEVLDDPGVMKGGPHYGGIDPQMDKAIELVVAELARNPIKQPPRPAYPNREGFGIKPEDK
jgi:tricorn protease-like protein/C-terminal processing protease CtpA/Prc